MKALETEFVGRVECQESEGNVWLEVWDKHGRCGVQEALRKFAEPTGRLVRVTLTIEDVENVD